MLNIRIKELPAFIEDLKRLEELNLGFTLITELPNTIGGLESLLELQWGEQRLPKCLLLLDV